MLADGQFAKWCAASCSYSIVQDVAFASASSRSDAKALYLFIPQDCFGAILWR
jgi:hypothetical protein